MRGMSQAGGDAYQLAFLSALGAERARILTEQLTSPARRRPRICLHTIRAQATLAPPDLPAIVHAADEGVLVVENIDLDCLVKLGITFHVDPAFFVEHATNPEGSAPWQAVFGKWSAEHRKPSNRRSRPSRGAGEFVVDERDAWHVDGVVEVKGVASPASSPVGEGNSIPRLSACDRGHGWQVTTRISYYLLTPQLYLVLVDGPVLVLRGKPPTHSTASERHELRVPLGLSRGGLVLPYLFEEPDQSIFACLQQFLSHPWHFHVLFAHQDASDMRIHLSPDTLFHLLASSSWETNLRTLDARIKQISFYGARRPDIRTIDTLHDQRRSLTFLLDQVAKTSRWMPPAVRSELEGLRDRLPAARYIGHPDVIQSEVLDSAAQLQKFLMDTFDLLLSTMSVLEAESTKEETLRGQRLTKLALVYGPLSFVTGIFGMNVKEINGSPLSIWVMVAVLGIAACCTGMAFAFHRLWNKVRSVWFRI